MAVRGIPYNKMVAGRICSVIPRQRNVATLLFIRKVVSVASRQTESPDPPTLRQSTTAADIASTQLSSSDRYIPITRRALVRKILEDNKLLTRDESAIFPEFAATVDAYIYQKFYKHLDEMKSLYDHLDPDKDTVKTHSLSRQQLFDNEYWLLKKIEEIVTLANYLPLPASEFLDVVREHDTTEGVRVDVDAKQYDILRLWTRGRGSIASKRLLDRIRNRVGLKSKGSNSASFTRVMIALRRKGSTKLALKIFKDVPCNQLEHLLPGGKIKMSRQDNTLIFASAGLLTLSASVKMLATVAYVNLHYSVAVMALLGLFCFHTWLRYSAKRNLYLANLSQFLFYKSIAHNRGVLTLLSDRAQDEEFKEMLLAYTFLLAAPNRTGVPGTTHTEGPPQYHTEETLKTTVEDWLKRSFGVDIHLDHRDAIRSLEEAGLCQVQADGRMVALAMSEALKILPRPLLSWSGVSLVRDSQAMDAEPPDETVSEERPISWV